MRFSIVPQPITVAFVLGCTSAQTAPHQVEVYPAAYPHASKVWRVEVMDSNTGSWLDAGAYEYREQSQDGDWHNGAWPRVHWATIGMSASARVRASLVTSPPPPQPLGGTGGQSSLSSISIHPDRYGITPISATATSFEFDINVGQKVFVDVNNQDYDTLFIFANPLDPYNGVSPPSNVHAFPPGVSTIGHDWSPTGSGIDTIYLPGGSWVKGTINASSTSSSSLRITGPGVLSGEDMDYATVRQIGINAPLVGQTAVQAKTPYIMIHHDYGASPAFDTIVEGITIVGSPYFNVSISSGSPGSSRTIRNVHLISPWTFNTDGFYVGGNSTVRNCFAFNNDDTLPGEPATYGSADFYDCVLAGRNSFKVGYGSTNCTDQYYNTFSRIDVVAQRARMPFRAQIDAPPGFLIQNETYKNITVHSAPASAPANDELVRLFDLKIEGTSWGHSGVGAGQVYGNVRSILFDGITLVGSPKNKSRIKGFDVNNTIGSPTDPIIFRNLVIDGVRVTNQNYLTFFEPIMFAFVDFQ